MKNILMILSLTFFVASTVKGQNLFFIGEKSYPCSETFILQSNSERGNDLSVLIAKDGNQGLLAVKTISNTRVLFTNKLIIYLNDGSVITCNETSKSDHMDNIALAAYPLTKEDLSSLKNSNIHTIRYTLKCGPCYGGSFSYEMGNFSASNKEIQTKSIITKFFVE